jgi:uncharacterized membrane-anchored protein YitT (DUF2179 family)
MTPVNTRYLLIGSIILLVAAVVTLLIDLFVIHTERISSSVLILFVLGTVVVLILPKGYRWFKVATVFGLMLLLLA